MDTRHEATAEGIYHSLCAATVSLCQAVLYMRVCVWHWFVCLIYSVPLHWLNAVNVKWQYFNVGNAGQCGF